MMKIEKGKRYVMVRIDGMYVSIHTVAITNAPDFSSPTTIMNYRVTGNNGLCFEDSPIHSSFLFTNLCKSFEHWVTLAKGYAIVDSKQHTLKYCRKAILWDFYKDENLVPFIQNMPAYGWMCSATYRNALAQLKELKL